MQSLCASVTCAVCKATRNNQSKLKRPPGYGPAASAKRALLRGAQLQIDANRDIAARQFRNLHSIRIHLRELRVL